MVITFKSGKVIATAHELVVRLDGEHRVTLQAQVDAIQLIGKGQTLFLPTVQNVNGRLN